MSWIFGYVSYNGRAIPENVSRMHDRYRHRIETHSTYIACGGPEPTCFFEEDGDRGWIACGLGLELDGRGSRVWSSSDWRDGLKGHGFHPPRSGHFVVVRWKSEEIEARTDPLGLRTIFFCQSDGGLFFSTRLDWVARAVGRTTLDLEELGSRFLAFTQLSYESGVEGIDRLGPGGILRYSKEGLVRADRPWTPTTLQPPTSNLQHPTSNLQAPTTTLTAAVEKLVHPRLDNEPVVVSLGLSGGIDSRTMLALASGRPNLACHVFGYRSEPDVVVARALAEQEELDCRWFDSPLPEADRCVDLLREFAAVASGFGFASDLIEKRHYCEICEHGTFLLFGLGGELLRRQFLNRFLMFGGHRALKRRDRDVVTRLLVGDGPGTIVRDASNAMSRGARQDVEILFDHMPDARSFGPQNWADLVMIRFRVANPHMAHQTLLDHVGFGYSPFEQDPVLDTLFSIPPNKRNNSKLSKGMIAECRSSLTEHPLVMHDAPYPFGMPTNLAILWTRFRTRRRMSFLQRARVSLLHHLEDFVRDLAFSPAEADNPVYDMVAIRRLVDSFYNGRTASAKQIEGWLTFALWRQSFRTFISSPGFSRYRGNTHE